jgi:hypothetical protein
MKYTTPQQVIKNVSVLPRIIILGLDLFCIVIASVSAVLLTVNFNFQQIQLDTLMRTIFALLVLSLFAFQINKSYFGIVRYTGPKDVFRILTAMVSLVLLVYAFKLILKRWLKDDFDSPATTSLALPPIFDLAIAGTKKSDCKKFLRWFIKNDFVLNDKTVHLLNVPNISKKNNPSKNEVI